MPIGSGDADLKHRLADVQLEYAKLAEECVRLRQELLDLREHAQTRQEMHYQDNVYWRRSGQDKLEGPFCPKCFDGHNKPARMSDQTRDTFWRCSVCHTAIRKPGAEPVRLADTSYDPFL